MPKGRWSVLLRIFTVCWLPRRLATIAPHMAAHDWLGSYRDFAVLEQVFNGIARRLSRPEELAGAMQDLKVLYEPLSEDFRAFYPQLQVYAAAQRVSLVTP